MRGGHREGAGRKPLPRSEKRRQIHVHLHPDVLQWIDAQEGTRGQVIEKLVINSAVVKK